MRFDGLDQEYCNKLEPVVRKTLAHAISPLLLAGKKPDRPKVVQKLTERAMVIGLILAEFSASLFQTFLLKGTDENTLKRRFSKLRWALGAPSASESRSATMTERQQLVHLCAWSQQPDIQLKCDQSWTTPDWKDAVVRPDDEDGEGGIYRAADGRLYTFTKSSVTCEVCKFRMETSFNGST